MAPYKLVAFDLDGTLLGEELLLRPRVLSAVQEMRERCIAGCVVTGRMYQAALPFVRQLQFTAPVVCYQGAAVIDPQTDDVLQDVPLPNAQALEIEAYARGNGLHIQLYANDRYYCEQRNRYSDLYAKISGVEPVIVPSLAAQFESWDATKACIIAEPEVVAEQLPRVRTLCGDRAYVTRSIPWFIEVMNVNVNKGKSLEIVARHLDVPMEQVLAVGDSWNDAPLLQAAGFGVAMGSAPPELRDIADAVVADVENDGVAEAIERYVLS
ncbi:MAG TPA: Cof-type HAD-IIB family hydrolase [Candidatus Baltobacteraceae bacterium]|nr:Cof-type HAD-IIB family hydrolase [Candidatus Baltobacteraceae bacterium]